MSKPFDLLVGVVEDLSLILLLVSGELRIIGESRPLEEMSRSASSSSLESSFETSTEPLSESPSEPSSRLDPPLSFSSFSFRSRSAFRHFARRF